MVERRLCIKAAEMKSKNLKCPIPSARLQACQFGWVEHQVLAEVAADLAMFNPPDLCQHSQHQLHIRAATIKLLDVEKGFQASKAQASTPRRCASSHTSNLSGSPPSCSQDAFPPGFPAPRARRAPDALPGPPRLSEDRSGREALTLLAQLRATSAFLKGASSCMSCA